MVNYRDSGDNACLKAQVLIDNFNSNPGSEYQFAIGCIDVFREFFKSLGAKNTLSNPSFIKLYQKYQYVMGSYRGKIDLSKIERSFNSTLEHNGVNLDDLASCVPLRIQTRVKPTIKGSNGSQNSISYTFTAQYLRELDYERRERERKARESGQKNGRRIVIKDKEELTFSADEKEAIARVRKENLYHVYNGMNRVKGLHNVLSGMYEECKLSDDGEFNERFIETWIDFRKEIVLLKEWLKYNKKIGSLEGVDREERQKLRDEVVENIDRYKGSPQQLFEKKWRCVPSSLPLESIFQEIESQLGELI